MAMQGKSTLLQSLLEEVDLLGGTASIELGTIGFCSQDPWLRTNNSIKENITFMHPYEAKWYWTVIIPEGDDCVVSNLSGGQKQR
jgi:ATP-binding cassette subfamily C (CFTR/MRP) protein 1